MRQVSSIFQPNCAFCEESTKSGTLVEYHIMNRMQVDGERLFTNKGPVMVNGRCSPYIVAGFMHQSNVWKFRE